MEKELIVIETNRLKIIALTLDLFDSLLQSNEALEKKLGLNPSGEEFDTHTKEAMEGLYGKAIQHKTSYYWYTNWQIIFKTENKSIGSLCFMGEADTNGTVEIGYGINKAYQNKGYMTEAAFAVCQWALKQPNIQSVTAETETNNIPSHRVLEKCGLIKDHQTDESIWWKIKKPCDIME